MSNTSAADATPPARHTARLVYFALCIAIILAAFGLRHFRLMVMPLYVDEASHIMWSFDAAQGRLLIGINDNKMLFPFLLSLLRPDGPESPYLGRLLSVLCGSLTTATAIGIGRGLGSRRVGLLAGAFYAVAPLAFFHERTALVDPLMSTFMALSTLASIGLARKPTPWRAALLAVALTCAYLAKLSALPCFVLPFLAALLLTRHRRPRWQALAYGAGAVAVAIVVPRWLYAIAAAQGITPLAHDSVTLTDLKLFHLLDPAIQAGLWRDLSAYRDIMWAYGGPIAVGLVALAGMWLVIGLRWREFLFIAIPAVGFAFAPMLTARYLVNLPGRYFVSTMAPLAVLMALSLDTLVQSVRTTAPRLAAVGGAAIALAALVPWFGFDAALIRDPTTAPLPGADRALFITQISAGYGHVLAAQDLLAEWWTDPDTSTDIVMGSIAPQQVWIYLGPRVGEMRRFRLGDDAAMVPTIARWVARGDHVYFIEAGYDHPLPEHPYGADLLLIRSYQQFDVKLNLYRLVGAIGPLAEAIRQQSAPDPGKVASSVAAAAADFGAGTLLVYPDTFLPDARNAPGQTVQPLRVDAWPPTPAEVDPLLARQETSGDAQRVGILLVSEDQTDPTRTIVTDGVRLLYRIRDAWFGPAHLYEYAAGPQQPEWGAPGVVYEDAISLLRVAVIDPEVMQGGIARFAVTWETSVPVRDSFKMFVHVAGADGIPVAQYDDVPGSGLLPTTIWQPGVPVDDRFAIVIPPDAPPGDYTIHIGLYRMDNGLRLRVTSGSDGPDYGSIGTVRVEPQH